MRDAHLSREELIAWRDRGTGDRDLIVTHLASCGACREVAADVERNRPLQGGPQRFEAGEFAARGYRVGQVSRPSQPAWRWVWAAAAAALVALAVIPVWLSRLDDGPAVVRGGDVGITLVRPVDASVTIEELVFEWTRQVEAEGSRLQVFDLENPSQPIIARDVDGTRYEPTADERARMRRGRTLYWFIEFRNANGVTMTAPAAPFTVK
jgi:hypothetical protein